jgi:enoyl-CoA hydratase/carnithine racemase
MSDVLYERDGAVATITLNRPERMNTISHPMLLALSVALLDAGRDPEVRAVILTGAGRAFCAGLDLNDAASEEGVKKGGFALAPTLDLREFPPVVRHQLDKPVVCAINGGAAGFGIDLTLGADVRVMASHAKLAITFTRRGVMPETGGTWYLPRLLGWSKAAELILGGRTLNAAEALELGLVSRVTEPDQLLAAARAVAAEFAAGAPLAVQASKRMMRAAMTEGFADHVAHAYLQVLPLMQSQDFREGFSAFLEKRPPKFQGR